VARLAHRRVVLVERLAVVENHSDVGAELFSPFVPAETNEQTARSAKSCLWHKKAASLHSVRDASLGQSRDTLSKLVNNAFKLTISFEPIKARKMNQARILTNRMQSFCRQLFCQRQNYKV
jgi:hypothetical protein